MKKEDNITYKDDKRTIGFNGPEIAKNFTLEEFKKHEAHHFEGDPEADKKLTDIFQGITAKFGTKQITPVKPAESQATPK